VQLQGSFNAALECVSSETKYSLFNPKVFIWQRLNKKAQMLAGEAYDYSKQISN